jgi:hypothetical protein
MIKQLIIGTAFALWPTTFYKEMLYNGSACSRIFTVHYLFKRLDDFAGYFKRKT